MSQASSMTHATSAHCDSRPGLTESALQNQSAGSAAPPGRFVGQAASDVSGQYSASTVSSNPTIWDNNIPRKTLDLQYMFSANPLRVADCGGKHWKRLTATYRSMIPQPGGGVVILKQKYNRVTDEDLYRQVANSGVSKPKPERKLPPLPDRRDVNTPLLRSRLLDKQMPPVPKPPKLTLVADRPIIEQLDEFHAQDDASSCFSLSTVAKQAGGRTSVLHGNPTNKKKGTSQVSAVSSALMRKDKSSGSVVSQPGGGGSQVGTNKALSKVSGTSSRVSRVSQLQSEIQREREARYRTEEQLSDVSQSLSRVEAILSDRK